MKFHNLDKLNSGSLRMFYKYRDVVNDPSSTAEEKNIAYQGISTLQEIANNRAKKKRLIAATDRSKKTGTRFASSSNTVKKTISSPIMTGNSVKPNSPVVNTSKITNKKILSIAVSIAGVIIVLIGIGVGKNIGHEAGNKISDQVFTSSKPNRQDIDAAILKGFNEASEKSNRRGPVMIDNETRLDKTAVGPGLQATYFYTLVNYSSYRIKPYLIQTEIRPLIVERTCTSNKMKPLLKHGATYVHVYSGSDGREISRVTINKYDCN